MTIKNLFFKCILGLLFISLIEGCTSSKQISVQTAVSQNGQLKVVGTQLMNEHGDAFVLRGVSYGWHIWWPRFYNQNSVSWLVNDWKCNVVRAAIGVGPDDSYLQNPSFAIEKLTSVIEGAIKEGIYVIVDFHTHEIYKEQAKTFFTFVAEKYGKHPNIIYEIFNEPIDQSWQEVKAYSEDLIKTIRAIDPNNIILVGSPQWCQDLHLVAEDPIIGQSNIMYTMHFYAGSHKKWLRDRTDAAIAKGIPVFVSECAGMEATGDGPIDYAEWNAYVEWMEKRMMSWVVWSIADKNETCSMLYPTADSKGGWTDDCMKDWGRFCRATIIKNSNK